jgi:hypothetical protein
MKKRKVRYGGVVEFLQKIALTRHGAYWNGNIRSVYNAARRNCICISVVRRRGKRFVSPH